MAIEINALVDNKRVSFSIAGAEYNKRLAMSAHILESPDNIYQISVSKDYLIVTAEDPDVRDQIPQPMVKRDRSINNINAYDWKGNHMWNIGEIVGDIRVPFFGGSVTTKDVIMRDVDDPSEICDDHEYFYCIGADDHRYIIDLTEKKLIGKVQTR